jgi:hypothetical protein
MEDKTSDDEKRSQKIGALNSILEDLISDSSELVKDLNWSVKTYLIFGMIMVLFGVQTLAYNIEYLQQREFIPLLVAGSLFFCGAAQIVNYFRLRKKYARLFQLQTEMKNH